ncbi:hypothetical protein ACN9M0_33840 [Streptomyces sp. R-07]|uniref:hypothetical protein n=1 Tax=unclassified Streptomyces TaxID=2593676 RepID=UPI00342F49F3
MTAAPGDDAPTPVLDRLTEQPPPPLPGLEVLRALTADAARRAAALLAASGAGDLEGSGSGTATPAPGVPDGTPGGLAAGLTADLARFVAETGDTHTEAAAVHLGLSVAEMRRLAAAHRFGGPSGVATCLGPLPADPEVLASAEHAVQRLRPAPTAPVERHHNHLTDAPARVQLRYGPDGLWHPYAERYGTWHPAGPPHPDPAVAYTSARTALRGPAGR